MYQFVLWFNMIAFTLMFASAGLSYLVYDRNRAVWLRDYLVYAAAYTVWLFFATWIFFRAVYLTEPLPRITLLFAQGRSVVSIFIVIFGPLFFFRCAGFELHGAVRAILIGVAAVVAAIIVTLLIEPIRLMAYAVTPAFNLYLSILSWIAFSRVRGAIRSARRPMVPLLLYSAVAYALLSGVGILLPLVLPARQGVVIHAIAAGSFLFGWAVLMIGVNMRWISRGSSAGSPIPDSYLIDYRITGREADVLALLVAGHTSAEIADKLFISQRTVEAHLYNVYRKCDVGNRVELVAKISSYGRRDA